MTTFVNGTACNITQATLVNGTACNSTQYQQFLQSFINGVPSVIVIFIWIGWNVRWYRKTFPKGDWKLFQGPADVYMFSLFMFESLQAMGGILDIWWAHYGIVETGHYCTAQGIIQQIGEAGVGLITLLLAVHTFVAAMWQVGLHARGVAFGMVCLACLFIMLSIGISWGINKGNYDTPTPYWCWIPLYFWAEGRLSVDEESWYKFHRTDPDQRIDYSQRRAALGMLLYPVAYSLVVLPISITRWLGFKRGKVNVPSAATFFGVIMFNLSGAINVLLFLIVRPHLLLFPRPEKLAEPVMELASSPQGTSTAIFSDRANLQHSPEPTSAALVVGEGSRNNPALSRINSRRLSDDV